MCLLKMARPVPSDSAESNCWSVLGSSPQAAGRDRKMQSTTTRQVSVRPDDAYPLGTACGRKRRSERSAAVHDRSPNQKRDSISSAGRPLAAFKLPACTTHVKFSPSQSPAHQPRAPSSLREGQQANAAVAGENSFSMHPVQRIRTAIGSVSHRFIYHKVGSYEGSVDVTGPIAHRRASSSLTTRPAMICT